MGGQKKILASELKQFYLSKCVWCNGNTCDGSLAGVRCEPESFVTGTLNKTRGIDYEDCLKCAKRYQVTRQEQYYYLRLYYEGIHLVCTHFFVLFVHIICTCISEL